MFSAVIGSGLFEPAELGLLLCGEANVEWSMEELAGAVRPGHAYTASDKPYVWLLAELNALTQRERGLFLSFVTSCPRLPPGGVAKLHILVDRRDTEGDRRHVSSSASLSCGTAFRCG